MRSMHQGVCEREHDFLCRGRMPFAAAELRGTEESKVTGQLLFYDTPAGVMVSAELEGLPKSLCVYGFCLCDGNEQSCRSSRGLCLRMPLVYGREGRGWSGAVTEGLRGISLTGRTVSLRESTALRLCHGREIARGIIGTL